jgi:hypothetical protein
LGKTRRAPGAIAALLFFALGACGTEAGANPELACQERIATAQNGAPDAQVNGDAFAADAGRWRALDRNGCTPDQNAVIDALAKSASALSALSAKNEEVGRINPDGAAHMAAFQAFNDALIAYDDLSQAEKRKYAAMRAD